MTKKQLAVAIAVNYTITASQAEDVLEVLGAVVQLILQQGGRADLPGIGSITVNEKGEIVFTPSERIKEIVENPESQVNIENVSGIPSGELYSGDMTIYKHKVNVC